MGYNVTLDESSVKIEPEFQVKVLKRWKDMNKPEFNDRKNGGCWQAGKRTEWNYSWMDSDYDEKCNTVGDVLEQLGFEYSIDDSGAISIDSYDNKTGQEELFFEVAADLLNGVMYWRGEDGAKWRWIFMKGYPMKIQRPNVEYEDSDEV